MRKPIGVEWKYRITVPYEDLCKRPTDFAWMIKVDGIWRALEEHEIEEYW